MNKYGVWGVPDSRCQGPEGRPPAQALPFGWKLSSTVEKITLAFNQIGGSLGKGWMLPSNLKQ